MATVKIDVPTMKASVSRWTKPSQLCSVAMPEVTSPPSSGVDGAGDREERVQAEQDDQRPAGGQVLGAAAPELEGGGEQEDRRRSSG